MADIILTRDQGIPQGMRTRYRDMGDGTHALVESAEVADATIGSIAVPAGNPRTGQAVIAVTGTAVRLIVASVPLPGGSVFLTARPTNTANDGRWGRGDERDRRNRGGVDPCGRKQRRSLRRRSQQGVRERNRRGHHVMVCRLTEKRTTGRALWAH